MTNATELNLTFGHSEKTLSDAEIEDIMNKVIEKLKKEFSAELR